ncbi:mycofactocin system glycosyltransferase [Cryobacterium levicorallinum]|uniref:Mycofactocin system glycosyltransferase n=1 Tax=Cryobacterium levicorallinum TaxID=995038 RepID=A0A1I3EKB9_9MICO|nr:mycofactocin biosynthesis glycosyltransferase MftF [Cryobacterium levicorallinum]TFB86331.1 mycofactocin system glycosyltransferase [Cryobacterium levicorallinum]GEP28797.1 putative glycosyltransferase [Cryobacterium levicorallinum]SFH99422.1 mycofactocin system glycosyltransferase [Cryobacterium levicorallinum]
MKPPAALLPPGFTVELNRTVTVRDQGRSLVGGSPTRAIYLSRAAVRMFAGRRLAVDRAGSGALVDKLLEIGMADPVLDTLPAADESDVTYVIPTYGRPQSLDRLLASIGPHKSVIVVDDASPDPSEVKKIAAAAGARFIALPENLGPAGARNAGLRLVQTTYVVFVDNDMVVTDGAVAILLRHFVDPRVALVAPRVIGLQLSTRVNWISRYEDARSSLDLGPTPATVRPRARVSWVSTAFVVARVEALGAGFSDGMRVGEDVDLVWTLVEQGWRVRYEPAATSAHEHRVTFPDWAKRKAFYGTGGHALALRHPGNIAPAILAPWSVGVIVAVLAQRAWSVPLALGISAVAAVRISRKLSRHEHPLRIGIELTATGVAASVSQTMALLTRHWWPIAVLGSIISRRVRRATIAAAILDVVLDYRRTKPQLDIVRFGIARRADDLAYGTGLWLGALRGHSTAALRPDIRGHR